MVVSYMVVVAVVLASGVVVLHVAEQILMSDLCFRADLGGSKEVFPNCWLSP